MFVPPKELLWKGENFYQRFAGSLSGETPQLGAVSTPRVRGARWCAGLWLHLELVKGM